MNEPVVDTSQFGWFEPTAVGLGVALVGAFFGAFTYDVIVSDLAIALVGALLGLMSPLLLYALGRVSFVLVNSAGQWLERGDHL